MIPRLFGALSIIIVLAPRAHAVRVEFHALHNGARVRGAEVCFFRAGESDHPVDRFLSSDEVRCLPADDVLELPVGRWGHFIRHSARQLVHALPSVLTNDQSEYEAAGSKVIADDLRPAATLDIASLRSSLQEGEMLGVYVANEATELPATLFPIPRSETRQLVPAQTTVVVLAVRDGVITRVAEPVKLVAGSTSGVKWMQERPVVNWLLFTAGARKPDIPWKQVGAPEVTLLADGKEHRPILPIRGGFGGDGSLLLFRAVPRGEWTLRVSGDVWQRNEVRNESQPLRTAPGSALRLRWTVTPLPSEPLIDCAPAKTTQDAIQKATDKAVRLLSCPSLQPGLDPRAVHRKSCSEVASAVTGERQREAMFRGIPPGLYLAEVTEPGHAPARAVVNLSWGAITDADLELRSFRVFGRLTRDGRPVAARLQFATGDVVSNGDGRYEAVLLRMPGAMRVNIFDCETGEHLATHIPKQPIPENVPYDIDLVSNVLHIRAVDASTGKVISGAILDTVALDERGDEFIGTGEKWKTYRSH